MTSPAHIVRASDHRRHGLDRPLLGYAAALLVLVSACSSSQSSDTQASEAPATAVPEVTPTNPTPTDAASPVSESTVAPDSTGGATTTAAVVPDGQTAIVVESSTDQYFVLYVSPADNAAIELPVAVVRGEAGTTTLTDGRTALADGRYRVEAFSVAQPGDVDGDGIDDLTELDDPVGSNPVNGAAAMDAETGAVIIPDRATYEMLSYQGDEVARDGYLAGLEFVKFWIVDADTTQPKVYFMNTENFRAHPPFGEMVGISSGRGPAPGKMRGDVAYYPEAIAPDGSVGMYRFAFQPNDAYSYAEIAVAYETLVNGMPELAGKLFYYPFPQSALPFYEQEKALYDAGRVPVLVE